MKRSFLLVLAFGLILLPSCGNDPSSSSFFSSNPISSSPNVSEEPIISSSQKEDELAFTDAISLLTSFAGNEGKASNETYRESTDKNGSKITLEKSLRLYSDHTSVGEGKVTRESTNGSIRSTTCKEATEVRTDRIATSNATRDAQMSYHAIDYADDSLTTINFKDDASRKQVVATKQEATSLGLSSNEYVLSSNLDYESSYQLNETLAEWIDNQLINNPYVAQTGKSSFEITTKENDITHYFVGISYMVEEEGYQVFTINDITFEANRKTNELLSFAIDYELHFVNPNDSEDTADEVYEYEGTLTYQTKTANHEEDKIIPYNYFLQDVTEIELLDAERKPLNPNGVTLAAHYLFAKPKAYTPSLALGIDEWALSRNASSDGTVVQKTDDGYFEIMSVGKTKLTFSYYGLNLSTKIWENKTIQVDILVSSALPKEITVSSLLTEQNDASGKTYSFNELKTNHTYVAIPTIAPAQANQEIVVTVADPNIIEASVEKQSETYYRVLLKALKEGTTEVTFASKVDPAIKVTKSFTVQEELSEEGVFGLIVGKTFRYTSSYGYHEDLTFTSKEEGTLTLVASTSTTFHFTYTAKNNDLTFHFTDTTDDDENYVFNTGTVSSDGKSVSCDNDTTYKTFSFSLVA